MTSLNLLRQSNDSDASAEEILNHFNPFIITQVEKLVLCHSHFIHPAALYLEIDEIVQKVRIKFWNALMEKQIQYPRAYIQRIIHNEFNDIGRRNRPPLPLSTDEDGEVNRGKVMVTLSEGMDDPASEFEQKEAIADHVIIVAEAVAMLPLRQQHAIICLLLERVDDVAQFVGALKKCQVNIGMTQWPSDKADAQRLKASISAARQKIVQHIKNKTEVFSSGAKQ